MAKINKQKIVKTEKPRNISQKNADLKKVTSHVIKKLNKQKAKKSGLKLMSKSIKIKRSNPLPVTAVDHSELLDELLKDEGSDNVKGKKLDPLQGFKVIKWKLHKESKTIHHLFVKKHEVSITELYKEKPPGRTLLCHNVPPFLYEDHVRDIFKTFGDIEKIFIHQNPTISVPEKYDRLFPSEKDIIRGFKVAYIVYKDKRSVKDLLEMDTEDVEAVVMEKPLNTGVSRWIRLYNSKVVSTQVLENSVRKFMDNFDKEEVKRKEMEKNANEPDDDGWITVTRTGKRSSSGLVRSEAMEERLREKKRRQERQLLNFTPAQVKESKMKQLIELKKKFEEDKQRVALLKQKRKFKPF